MSDVMDEMEEELPEFGHSLRQLTAEEITKLKSDTNLVSKFHQNKFEKEAKKNWDLFYKRNTNKFFKNRHWTTREFEELITNTSDSTDDNSIENSLKCLCLNECDNQDERLNSSNDKISNLLEVGCGVGNLIWPLIEEGTKLFIYACDFSSKAIDLLKKNPLYDESKCYAFEVDITQVNMNNNNQDDDSEDNRYSTISSCLPHGVMIDIVSLVFVLSAIHPDKMETALKNIYQVLRPGGLVLFRDYGLYDHAMLRFTPGHKLSDNFYVRQDGTRAYYFSLESVATLLISCGFKIISNEYISRETVNKKQRLCVPRVFVQGKFVK